MRSLLDEYDALLVDLDGTVHHGSRVIPGAAEILGTARERATAVRFVTNNASRSPAEVAERLGDIGIATEPVEVVTSAQAAAAAVADAVPDGSTVLVVGTPALGDEVSAVGMRVTRTCTDDVAAVVQGHSPDTGWADLAEACQAITAGARWVACNTDPTLPTERGQLPGNGAMVAALRTATGLTPTVAGKPAPLLLERAARTGGARRPLVVGDRLDTDIAGASAADMDGILVLSGVHTPRDVLAAAPGRRPTYVAADITSLTEPGTRLSVGPRPAWRVDIADGTLRASSVSGCTDPLELLRALCVPAWQAGVDSVKAADEHTAAVLARLPAG
ncbi:Haloacid Dehalogenase Superfamily Class (subfamily) IIA [Haloechinothrix alba]|uniref:Haloacid Dehalogenase Superfamily Class (Subfamily) IIA n=1 Tax=Haloechinothrix alba TaxID=664784 RepID=A0A239AM04_9PSEU|nr:HAD-IIA family hydrolase [Haloechinothrix alba]SNR96687.1 Haloacid Dehalogenase Superfamily Class (subfamily) IIA [Haloechinothrix alba]